MAPQRIIIIGAGIGGLTAALALQHRGFDVTVYERAHTLGEIGAGLIVTANARRALNDLGIDDALAASSSCSPLIHSCNYPTAAILGSVDNAALARRYGYGSLQVHRADLHALLLAAVTPAAVHPAHTVTHLDQDRHSVRAYFANGHTDEADAVIAADGNASAIRSFLHPDEPTQFNGQVAFRALIPDALITQEIRDLGAAMHPAPKRYVLHYPLRGGQIMNLIGCGQSASWEAEGWSIPATNEEFASLYADFSPQILALIHSIPPGALFKWGLRDREPLAQWVTGRVAMLGDAAHPMTPFLGQGACLAIEDALVLARAFAQSDSVEHALALYEQARQPRGTAVQLASREEGQALQDPTRKRRSAIDRGLLDYDPVTAPLPPIAPPTGANAQTVG